MFLSTPDMYLFILKCWKNVPENSSARIEGSVLKGIFFWSIQNYSKTFNIIYLDWTSNISPYELVSMLVFKVRFSQNSDDGSSF